MQSFMGTINFMQRFVPNFAQIVKPLQLMVKQSVQFKWTNVEKNTFSKIKTAIAHAPSLNDPEDYSSLIYIDPIWYNGI